MRTTKFRGKNRVNGKWEYGYLLGPNVIGEVESLILWCADVDPDTVGEFTGLKDKDGVEIFDGDVIKYFDINGESCTSEVFWDDDFAGFNPWAMSSGITNVEVIGNIYETPHLIEGAA